MAFRRRVDSEMGIESAAQARLKALQADIDAQTEKDREAISSAVREGASDGVERHSITITFSKWRVRVAKMYVFASAVLISGGAPIDPDDVAKRLAKFLVDGAKVG